MKKSLKNLLDKLRGLTGGRGRTAARDGLQQPQR
jgi:hypothetical protein